MNNIVQEASYTLPEWSPPLPPGFKFYYLQPASASTEQENDPIIQTRESIIPYWVTTKNAPREIKYAGKDLSEINYKEKSAFYSANLPLTDPHAYFSIQFDNDVFFSMDYYYTNGIKFSYVHPTLQLSRIMQITIPYRKRSLNYYGMHLVQNMYTPTRLDLEEVLVGDRPFASYLYLGFFKTTFDDTKMIKIHSGFDMGMLGPTSLGGLIQTTMHSTEPTGWVNQIGNDVVLSYHAMIEKGILEKGILTWLVSGGGIAGTLYNNLYISTTIMAGKQQPYFSGKGLQCGTNITTQGLQYNVFAGLKTTVVGYDATLQGGVFSSNDVYSFTGKEIKRSTLSVTAGFNLKYKWLWLTGKIHYITPEFKGGRDHKWISIGTTFCL